MAGINLGEARLAWQGANPRILIPAIGTASGMTALP
jgi:hypothetical protein